MVKVDIESTVYKDGKLMLSFDKYKYNKIVQVRVANLNGFSSSVSVEYALNNVTSDLLPIGKMENPKGTELIFDVEYPVPASQIFICASESDFNSIQVELYASETYDFDCYPKCIDKDLEDNYYLDAVLVTVKGKGYADYSIYTSMNGRDFELLSECSGCAVEKENKIDAIGREARFIRVYLQYCSVPVGCSVDVSFNGKKSGTPIQELPPIEVLDFCDSKYNVEITDNDTYNEVYGIIERRIGAEYTDWFDFALCQNPHEGHDFDYFELSYCNGRILIKGNNGVSLCVGLNHYLKYYCKVNISQVGDQVRMPESIVALDKPIFKETKAKVRYAYNYCTLSYTMAFWGAEEWRKELDWLALNGVNAVLDITAQEEVWRRFLTEIGYSHNAIKSFLTGPAYYAWLYMANITGIGGPIHDSWFARRTELARENHLIMRKLGMYPILQGYSGMMPLDIKDYDGDAPIIEQGTWGSAERPPMLRTNTDAYNKYAQMFYECQRKVYGDYSFYYAADPFHEGGRTEDLNPADISEAVLSEMLKDDYRAVWIIQSWQGNPSSELLKGLQRIPDGREHAVILDLYAEKTPHYTEGKADNPNHGYSAEFDGTPWIYCMLNNFGGRLGLHGHLDNLVKNVPIVFNTTHKNVGIGITPEASENNPLLYDFFFDCIWQDNAAEPLPEVDIDTWLCEYAQRRYGAKSESAIEALKILKNTVYKAELNMIGQGAPECIINARPALEIQSASTWGNSVIGYDIAELEKALALLKNDYDILKHSQGYMYDLVTLALQVLSNRALECHKKLKPAYDSKDTDALKKAASEFLTIADKMEYVSGLNEYYTLERYIRQAEKLSDNTDDFTKNLYICNLKQQITTWTSHTGAVSLHDYSNRQWSGMFSGFYRPRWERWLNARINELENKPYEGSINWFEWEWRWCYDREICFDTEHGTDIIDVLNDVL